MSRVVHAFEYLAAPERHPPAAVCAVFGDDGFLRRLAAGALRRAVLGPEDDTPYATFSPAAEWRDVRDELATHSLFGGGKRFVVVEEADDFVSRLRGKLEDYCARPQASGVLVLLVDAWPANTRLYKSLAETGLAVDCRPPERTEGKRSVLDEARIVKWLIDWARTRHGAALQKLAAELLLELSGPHFGLLDQELAKLALYVGPTEAIGPDLVRDAVGGWRTKTVWELCDAAASGRAAEALEMLDHALAGGQEPIALFGQLAWSFRRYAAATRLFERAERSGRRMPLGAALEQAGIRDWPKGSLKAAEDRVLQLGRRRAGRLYRELLELDLSLKGSHSHGDRARLAVELFVVRLARELSPAPRR